MEGRSGWSGEAAGRAHQSGCPGRRHPPEVGEPPAGEGCFPDELCCFRSPQVADCSWLPPPANPMVPLFMASAARHFCCRGVFFFLASLTPGGAVAVVIDTFDEGPFHETTDQSAGRAFYQHGSMLGGRRLVRISTDRRTTGGDQCDRHRQLGAGVRYWRRAVE